MNKSNLILASVSAIIFISILIIFSPTPIPTTVELISPTPDPTADWKTYNNTSDRISFMYPSSYLLKQTGIPKDYIAMFQGKDYQIVANDFGSKNTGSYYYLSLNIACSPVDIVGDKKILSTTNNSTVYAISGYEGPNYKSAIFNHNDLCFELNCVSDNGCEGKSLTEFNQILSTFKFTSPDYLLEDGSTYQKVNNSLSWDDCGTEDNEISRNIKQKISALAEVSEKEINGLKIISTVNLGFTQADINKFKICQAGAFSPLKVFSNKILWISSCGTGAYWEGVEKCEKTRTTIQKLYNP